ncbi:MAG: hypothetical protein ACFCVG_04870 [Kineosporiaceae bacterium]
MSAGDVDLEAAAGELYGLDPGDFLARRSEWVARARACGARGTAAALGRLRRPTVTAWLVNLVARDPEGAAGLAELAALGERTRTAQAALDAAALREHGRRRRELVRSLVDRADDLAGDAGHPVTTAVERELAETFAAAVATEEAAAAVTSGTLTRALMYSGFGDVDVEAAAAVPRRTRSTGTPRSSAAEPASPPTATAEQGGPDQGPQRAAAELLAAAETESAAARAAAEEARRQAEAARDRRDAVARDVDDLHGRLAEAQRSLAAAESELAAAGAQTERLDAVRRIAESALAERRQAAVDLSG